VAVCIAANAKLRIDKVMTAAELASSFCEEATVA
jgi:hypothetical protein